MDGPGDGWCGRCDKCRFVQLALAPFCDRAPLDRGPRLRRTGRSGAGRGFAAMLDADTKPFECVGTVEEVRLALDLLAADPDWRDAPAVRVARAVRPRLGRTCPGLARRLDRGAPSRPGRTLPAPVRPLARVADGRGGRMIVVLGHGRETRAWLERRLRTGPAWRRCAGARRARARRGRDGRWRTRRRGSTSTTSAAVRAAVGDRRVDAVLRSPGISPYRPGTRMARRARAVHDADRTVAARRRTRGPRRGHRHQGEVDGHRDDGPPAARGGTPGRARREHRRRTHDGRSQRTPRRPRRRAVQLPARRPRARSPRGRRR
jgi:hypothetical protein